MGQDLNILYVTWWEGMILNGIYRNQVIGQLKAIKKAEPRANVCLLIGGPFLRLAVRELLIEIPLLRRILKSNARNKTDTDLLEKDLKGSGIGLVTRETIIFPSIYLNATLLLFFPAFHLHFFKRLSQRREINLVHCRSYSAALIALLTKTVFRLPYKVLFDTRGLVPEEGVLRDAFPVSSLSYRLWKRVEKWLLNGADAIVNVSETFSEHIAGITANKNIFTIYTSVDTSAFLGNTDGLADLEQELNLQDKKVLVFMGSISEKGWYTVTDIVSFYSIFREVFASAKLLIISPSFRSTVLRLMDECGMSPADYVLTETKTNTETARHLKLAHYALLPFRQTPDSVDALIGRTVITSKIGEYLASGLPVICDGKLGGARRIIAENGLGCIYDGDRKDLARKIRNIEHNYDRIRNECRNFSTHFDVHENARKYSSVYRRMLTIPNPS
jgi:glycosyltransferase involved in cell wall biosynthesis